MNVADKESWLVMNGVLTFHPSIRWSSGNGYILTLPNDGKTSHAVAIKWVYKHIKNDLYDTCIGRF